MGLFSRKADEEQERAAIKDAFGLLGVTDAKVTAPRSRREFELVIVFVRDSDLDEALESIARTVSFAVEQGAEVLEISGSLIVVGLGVLPVPVHDRYSPGGARQFSVRLGGLLGDAAAVLYGRFDGVVGNVGTSDRMTYTALARDWKSVLGRAAELEWGEVGEWPGEQAAEHDR